MIVRDNKYIAATHVANKNLLDVVWKPATERMTLQEFTDEMQHLFDFARQNGVKYWLGDTFNFMMVIPVDMQTKLNENLALMMINVGVKKMALLQPEELIASLALEQAVQEGEKMGVREFEVRYFFDRQKALDWLK